MIQIFSTDSFKRDNWNLPFIRIGTMLNHNSGIQCNTDDNIEQYELPVSEFNTIYWSLKHLDDFGNPEYIGFCHYRRFFGNPSLIKQPLIQFQTDCDIKYILTPIQQYSILKTNNLDGFSPTPFIEHYHSSNLDFQKSTNAYEEAYNQGIEDNVKFSLNTYKLAFDNLLKFTPDNLKQNMHKAISVVMPCHFGSIFTLRIELIKLYMQIVFSAMINTLCEIDKTELLNSNSRSFGYILERLTSAFLHMLKFSGKRIVNMPLIVTNCNVNPSYRCLITKDVLKCDIDSFKEKFYAK